MLNLDFKPILLFSSQIPSFQQKAILPSFQTQCKCYKAILPKLRFANARKDITSRSVKLFFGSVSSATQTLMGVKAICFLHQTRVSPESEFWQNFPVCLIRTLLTDWLAVFPLLEQWLLREKRFTCKRKVEHNKIL